MTYLICTINFVFLIFKLNLSNDLMIKGPQESIVEHVALIIEPDFAAITESYHFLSNNL